LVALMSKHSKLCILLDLFLWLMNFFGRT